MGRQANLRGGEGVKRIEIGPTGCLISHPDSEIGPTAPRDPISIAPSLTVQPVSDRYARLCMCGSAVGPPLARSPNQLPPPRMDASFPLLLPPTPCDYLRSPCSQQLESRPPFKFHVSRPPALMRVAVVTLSQAAPHGSGGRITSPRPVRFRLSTPPRLVTPRFIR